MMIATCAVDLTAQVASAHGDDDETRAFLLQSHGTAGGLFLYIGAKRMVTGYDHLLFLVGVIFFLYSKRDILTYVSFFALGLVLIALGCWRRNSSFLHLVVMINVLLMSGAFTLVAFQMTGYIVSKG